MPIIDDRTSEQLATHPVLVGGHDTFMSGWGLAKGRRSYAFWACRPENVATVRGWVDSRSDIEVTEFDHGSDNDLKHIYVVCDNHPALDDTEK